MKKSLKIAVAGIGVGVVSLAGVGLASAHGSGDSETRSEITDRVAAILGVDSAELGSAFDQARDEVRTEMVNWHPADADLACPALHRGGQRCGGDLRRPVA